MSSLKNPIVKKNPPARSRRDRQRLLLALLVGGGLSLALGAALMFRLQAPVKTLPYGQFRKLLEAGEIASARLGPSVIEGRLEEVDRVHGKPIRFRVSRVGMEHDEDLIRLLDEHIPGGDYEAESGASPVQTVIFPGALFLLMLLALSWVVSRSGGMGSAMAFAKSRPRVYTGSADRVTFEDVAGHDEVVTELKEVVEFLRTPAKYSSLGGRVPKGVLLIGSPGTGKTLLARAVAGEAGVPFFSLSGSDFVELFVGVGASRVRNLFARAQAKAPCLIFIDELDAIGKARGSGGPGGHDERDQTLNQLLVEMDGFDANRGIILLAATNRPETLDQALVRPGRFDRQVVVDRPDLIGREQILKVHARAVPLEETTNLRHIAAITPGFVGADLANLVNEAALLAARRGKTTVGLPEFEEGIERLIAGPESASGCCAARRSSGSPSTKPGMPWWHGSCLKPIRFTKSRSSAAVTEPSAIRCTAPKRILSCTPARRWRARFAACSVVRWPRNWPWARPLTAVRATCVAPPRLPGEWSSSLA